MSDERIEQEIAERPRPDAKLRDGIGEDDHPIPRWFNLTFLASIVFALIYFPYYHVFADWSARGQYDAEVAADAAAGRGQETAPLETNPYHGNAAAIADGQQVFSTICAACHKPDGSGLVGPSLVDPYWKYGNTDPELFETLMKGRPAGMPAWGPQLGSDKIWRALAYLETLPKTDKPGMGAPTGDAATPAAPAAPPPPSGS